MEGSTDIEFSAAIRCREDYERYEDTVDAKKQRIEDPNTRNGRAEIDNLITELDDLYEAHTSGSLNTVIIDADQRAFKNTVDVISRRMKNQARGIPGEITENSMISALSDWSTTVESGEKVLESIGNLLLRGSKVTALPHAMPTMSEVTPQARPTYTLQQQTTGPPVRAGTADDRDFATELIQRRTQGKIMTAVTRDELVNDFEPLLLYRLCFDKYSFVRTVENFFAISDLVKEQKLWIGSNKRGLPVIGSSKNRPKYLANHPTGDYSGPDKDIDLVVKKTTGSRQQFNLNLNYELYDKLQQLFGDEEPYIVRNDYDDKRSASLSSAQANETNSEEEELSIIEVCQVNNGEPAIIKVEAEEIIE